MTTNVNRQWLLVKRPEGSIQADVFQLVEKPIPAPEQGQVLVRNLWLSFDPTQSGWMRRDTYIPIIPLGDVMRAASVGQVIESRHPDYKPGQFVQGAFGWQDYIATDGKGFLPMRSLPAGVEPNLALACSGSPAPPPISGCSMSGRPRPAKPLSFRELRAPPARSPDRSRRSGDAG